MTLTCHDAIMADLSTLLDASSMWKKMGTRFGELETDYKQHVNSLSREGGGWTGGGSQSHQNYSDKTLHEFHGAKKQAKAIASLLEDAYNQLTDLQKKVQAECDAAVKAGMKVNEYGRCTFDFSGFTAAEKRPIAHDPGLANTENEWTRKIHNAVQKLSDADNGVKLALEAVTQDQDGKGALNGFNSEAIGDVEKYEGQRAAELSMRLNSGEGLSKPERQEFQRLLRDNKDDTTYSRTFLNSLGHKATIKLANRLGGLTHKGEANLRGQYKAIEAGIADSLATATRVAGRDKDGDREYAREWLSGLEKVGTKEFDGPLEPDPGTPGSDQKVRGYQSIMTLIESGDPEGYSSDFLQGLTQDIYEAERESKGNIWDTNQYYSGKEASWFANDPLDSALGVLASHPNAATEFLDPGPSGRNEKLDYLINERDWEGVIADQEIWHGNVAVEREGEPSVDTDARQGFGAALEAATTGHEPLDKGDSGGPVGPHSPEQARVMQETIISLDMGSEDADNHGEVRHGEEIPANIRKNLAHAMADYVPDTYAILSESGGRYDSPSGGDIWSNGDGDAGINANKGSIIRVMRGISSDGESYDILYEANRMFAAGQLADAPQSISPGDEAWKNRAANVGESIGVMNGIGADVILDERDTKAAWAADVQRYSYHALGGAVTGIPVVGDIAQRTIDAVGYEWQKDVTAIAQDKAQAEGSANYEEGITGTYRLLDQFATDRGIEISPEEDPNYRDRPLYGEWEGMRREAKNGYSGGRGDAESALGWN